MSKPATPSIALGFISYTAKGDEPSNLSHFTITSSHPNSSGVIAQYTGMAGNLPGKYQNTIALWKGEIPNLNSSPLVKAEITSNDQDGDTFIQYPLQQLLYSLTYQVGKKLKTMCALAKLDLRQVDLNGGGEIKDEMPHIPKAGTVGSESATDVSGSPTYVELQILELTTTSIKILYNTLPGYLPETYQNWIGVWQGYALPYNAPAPLRKSDISGDYSQGAILLDNISFSEYLTYTLIYFTGTDNTNAAALLYFDTKSKNTGAI